MSINRLMNVLKTVSSSNSANSSTTNPNIPIKRVGQSKTRPKTLFQELQHTKLNNVHEQTKAKLETKLTSTVHMPIEIKRAIFESIQKGDISSATKKTENMFYSSAEITTSEKEIGLKQKLIAQFENEGWDQLTTNIEHFDTDFTNELTPYNLLDLEVKGKTKNIFNDVVKKHQGISCYNTNNSIHAANLWHSRLIDEQGREIFSGIRHASLSHRPTDTQNKSKNQQIVKGKVKELVLSALMSKYKTEIEQRINENIENTKPLKLKLSSTSLLTLFDMRLGPINESEESQFYQQKQALDELQAELNEITIDGITIPIKLEAISFSAGVNNFALGSSIISNLMNTNSWKKADAINRQSLQVLLGDLNENAPLGGWAKEYIDSLTNSDEDQLKKKKIQTIIKDIQFIFTNKLHHHENGERYAFPKRLIYLTYLIEAVPAFNCKSGKDRTGMVDAEVKALAATLSHQQDQQESINTQTEIETLRAFHLDSSNFEIQRLNSGLSGNKVLKKDSEYFNTIFTPEQLALIKGLV